MSVAEQRALAVVMAKSTLTDVEVMEAFLAAMQVRSPAVLRGTSNSKASGEEGSGEMSERTCQWGNRDYDADEPRDLAPCAAMATHTSCQTWPRYVCAEHKCRCSKPLADPINGKIMGKPYALTCGSGAESTKLGWNVRFVLRAPSLCPDGFGRGSSTPAVEVRLFAERLLLPVIVKEHIEE